MAKVWKLLHSPFLRYPTAFSQNTFLLRKWLSFVPRAPESPQVPEQRCLEYQYRKVGRWNYFGQGTPQYQSRDVLHNSTHNLADETTLADGPPSTRAEMPWIPVQKIWQMNLLWPMDSSWSQSRDALNTSTQNLADEPTLANGPPISRAEMTCIPLHKTWQMNLLWPVDPPGIEHRCLEYCYTKLCRQTYFCWGTPQEIKNRCLEYCYTKLGRWTFFGQWPPSTRIDMNCIPLHKTW